MGNDVRQWRIVRVLADRKQYWCDKESRWVDDAEQGSLYRPKPNVKYTTGGGTCWAEMVK